MGFGAYAAGEMNVGRTAGEPYVHQYSPSAEVTAQVLWRRGGALLGDASGRTARKQGDLALSWSMWPCVG